MKTYSFGKSTYHDPHYCPKCKTSQITLRTDGIDGLATEYDTICPKCNHKDHWVTGFFQSICEENH